MKNEMPPLPERLWEELYSSLLRNGEEQRTYDLFVNVASILAADGLEEDIHILDLEQRFREKIELVSDEISQHHELRRRACASNLVEPQGSRSLSGGNGTLQTNNTSLETQSTTPSCNTPYVYPIPRDGHQAAQWNEKEEHVEFLQKETTASLNKLMQQISEPAVIGRVRAMINCMSIQNHEVAASEAKQELLDHQQQAMEHAADVLLLEKQFAAKERLKQSAIMLIKSDIESPKEELILRANEVGRQVTDMKNTANKEKMEATEHAQVKDPGARTELQPCPTYSQMASFEGGEALPRILEVKVAKSPTSASKPRLQEEEESSLDQSEGSLDNRKRNFKRGGRLGSNKINTTCTQKNSDNQRGRAGPSKNTVSNTEVDFNLKPKKNQSK